MSKAYKTTSPSSSGLPYPALALIGAILMVVGTFVSVNVAQSVEQLSKGETATGPVAFLAGPSYSLSKMGIPLDLGATVATVGVLLIVFPLVAMFFTKPLDDAITERNSNLEHTFSEAESLRADMAKLRTDYEARLVASEASARVHIESQIKEAQNLRVTLMNEAATRADAMIDKAQQEIASERERILGGLRQQVVEMSLAAAEKIVGENMDTDRNRKLVDEFVSGLEVAR